MQIEETKEEEVEGGKDDQVEKEEEAPAKSDDVDENKQEDDDDSSSDEEDGDNEKKEDSDAKDQKTPPKEEEDTKDTTTSDKQENSKSDNSKEKADTSEQDKENTDTKEEEEAVDEEDRTIFVGNLPPNTTRKSLSSIFKSCGKIQSCRLRSVAISEEGVKLPPSLAGNQKLVRKVCVNTSRLNTNIIMNSSQGYVVFQSKESIPKALALNHTPHPNNPKHILRVDTAKPTVDSTRSIFLGNLPYDAEEDAIRQHFITNAVDLEEEDVVNVRLVRDPSTMSCKGFGYVLLKDATCVPSALRLHETVCSGKKIRVLVCKKHGKKKKDDKSSSSSGNQKQKRNFEGHRANVETKKSKNNTDGSNKKKKRRTKSERNAIQAATKPNAPHKKGTTSKRVAKELKTKKRVKKIQKRVEKGMGKNKKK
mmetsp:Transcript_19268/g.28064  ORF Transcript_19268/g.28064 Transcript_19268/m.28064 type:complete len:422 (-) Transcript_19268:107-1372(-)